MDLTELQKRIDKLEKEKRWINSPDQKIVFLIEELGEVVKWVRKARTRKLSPKEKQELNSEFADVIQHLVSLANGFEINLEEGLKKKKYF